MSGSTRTAVLLTATVLLLGAVMADRAGLVDRVLGAGGASEEPYLVKAQLVADQEALIAERSAWERAAAEARRMLEGMGERVIHAPSVSLAENELRERVRREMESVGLTLASSVSATPSLAGTVGEQGVHRVGLTLSLITDDPLLVTRLVDLLENMNDLVTSIERVELRGPGAMQARPQLEATITIMGLAIINGDAA